MTMDISSFPPKKNKAEINSALSRMQNANANLGMITVTGTVHPDLPDLPEPASK